MTLLAAMAKQEIAAGYPAGHKWEALLRDHVQMHNPTLVKELGESLQDYLTTTVSEAINLVVRLTNEGMSPMAAEFEARREMFPRGEDDAADDLQMSRSTTPPETLDTTTPSL